MSVCPKCKKKLEAMFHHDKELSVYYCADCGIVYRINALFDKFGFVIYRYKKLKEK